MNHLLFLFLLFVGSTLLALVEIQIEGNFGGGEHLPTWRKNIKILRIFWDHELSGYFLYFFGLMFFLTHFAFIIIDWSFRSEALLISFFLFMIVLEDFLWFVFNKDYGLAKFKKENISWHKKWILGFPYDYWTLIPLGIVFYIIANFL